MKRIRLIEEHTNHPELYPTPELAEADRLDYVATIRQVLRQPLQSIPWLDDAEKSIRIINALDGKKVGDIFELEDADHAHLCQHVRAASWAVFDERLLRFAHAILNATEHVADDPLTDNHASFGNNHNRDARSTTRRVERGSRRVRS